MAAADPPAPSDPTRLTLAQRAALTGGADMWHGVAFPEVGVGRLKVTDGPAGARGERMTGTTSMSFPCATALAATWNVELVERVGEALGQEARSKGAHVLLAPTVNLHRTPLAGRNFECFSEDPVLTAEMAVAYIEGVQRTGVGACIKHFVANEQETERMTVSVEVDERTLRELSLVPFEAAVRRAGVVAVMSAYNRLNGTYCSEHRWLLTELLRDEWGFDGFVVSDWFGTHSTEALAAGLDLEMPGPPSHLGERVLAAIESGQLSEGDVDRAAGRLLEAIERLGVTPGEAEPERSEDTPERRAVAREAAAEAIVVLTNPAGVLPLDTAALRRVAVIGPNADAPAMQGGGSAQVSSARNVTPLEALHERLGAGVEVVHEPGCSVLDGTTVLDPRWLEPGPGAPGGREHGLLMELVDGDDPTGPAVHAEVAIRPHAIWIGAPAEGLRSGRYAVRGTATFRPHRSGTWTFGLQSVGRSRLLLDGAVVVDNSEPTPGGSFFGMGSSEVTSEVQLDADRDHELEVQYVATPGVPVGGVSLKARAPLPADALERAVSAARDADVAVVVVGTTTEWETEGADRPYLDLPGGQPELIRAVTAVNPRTVVVLNCGAPVTVDWAGGAGAVVQQWFGGQEGGLGLVDVLVGDVEPSGRLPVTFPGRIEDTPAYGNFPGADGKVHYAEGPLIGYRHYDNKGIAPAFCFGHGLAYTTFEHGAARLEVGADGRPALRVPVTNTGARRGTEVVQVYVRASGRPSPGPDKELVGFAKIRIEPGATVDATITLDSRAWTYWSPDANGWVTDEGGLELLVAHSSRDLTTSVALDPATCPDRLPGRTGGRCSGRRGAVPFFRPSWPGGPPRAIRIGERAVVR